MCGGVLEGQQREGGLGRAQEGTLKGTSPACGCTGFGGAWSGCGGGSRMWGLSRVLSGTGQGTVCLTFFL